MNRERYRIRFSMKAEGEVAEVMIYGDIASEKWWDDDTTPGDFDKALKEARKGGATKLNLRINSGGGEVYAAVAMRSMIINAGFTSVRVMIEGLCASAATLFATVPGASVVIAEGSEFMIHNPMTIAWGNAEEIAKTVEHLHKMEEQFHGMYAARTGQSEAQIREWMDAETWFTAKEACEAGFADELLESEAVAACVSAREMGVMKAIYHAVPESIGVVEDMTQTSSVTPDGATPSPEGKALETVSNGTPVAGGPTEIQNHEEEDQHMDIRDIDLDQLRAENPALFDQIRQDAVSAERQRIEDIDALTLPGYEAMAAQAKADGTSAMDFQRQVVQAQKQKGAEFIASRQAETAPAAEVRGSEPATGRNEDEVILDTAREIAAYARDFAGSTNEGMF